MIGYIYILLTLLLTAIGQLVLKWRLNSLDVSLPEQGLEKVVFLFKLVFDPFVFSGLVLAFIASITWMAALTRFEISFAYPFMALNFIIVPILGIYFLDESVTVLKMFGLGLIVAGVVLVARG